MSSDRPKVHHCFGCLVVRTEYRRAHLIIEINRPSLVTDPDLPSVVERDVRASCKPRSSDHPGSIPDDNKQIHHAKNL